MESEAGNTPDDETKPRHRYGPARFVSGGRCQPRGLHERDDGDEQHTDDSGDSAYAVVHHRAGAAVPRRLPPPASVREGVGSLRLSVSRFTAISLVEEDSIALMPNLGRDRLLSRRM